LIREAGSEELDSVLDMYEWLFEPPGRRPPGWNPARASAALRSAIEAEDSVVLVAELEGELVGLCTAYLELNSVRFGQRCWVEDLAVDPARRSRGIGARLLGAARDWAQGRGATHLELDTGESRADAQRFYEREGAVNRSISYAWELER
jgi:GNAT superfamily N-acetyltransferase